jgi:hypothetical protein
MTFIASLRWWWSLQQNHNFWDWVRNTYPQEDLRDLSRMTFERKKLPEDFWWRGSYEPGYGGNMESRRQVVVRLLGRYQSEIWSACIGAGGYRPGEEFPLAAIGRLPGAGFVFDHKSFEDFLVRNAMKYVATKLLEERRG